jgi:ABC-2 type transport system permease protein
MSASKPPPPGPPIVPQARPHPHFRVAPYLAAARLAARSQATGRSEAIGRAFFLAALMVIFSQLWKHVPLAGSGVTSTALVWYLAITEWVLLSVPSIHVDMERDVRTGDIAYLLPRPVSYLGVRVAEALGSMVVRLAILGVVAAGLAFLLGGGLPERPEALAGAAVLGVLAATLGVVAQAAIGATAVWIVDVNPVYWIWQKAAFVLGGLVLPLHLYPTWLQAIARWTPFSAFLNGPARTVFAPEVSDMLATGGLLVLWLSLAALAATWLHRRGLRVLDVNGG